MRRPLLLACLLALALPGQSAARVMHGQDADPGEFPWSVALVDPNRPPVQGQFCGGSLIAPDMVVTAAHCTVGSRASEIDVFAAGDHDLADPDAGEIYDVEAIYVPADADVDADVPRRDIAILELDQPVTGGQPIGLVAPAPAAETDWAPGDDLEVMGWGRWHLDGFPDVLQHATVERWSDASCQSSASGFEASDMMCALDVQGDGDVVDSCNGDSGGPLTTHPPGADPTDAGDWKLVGTVSYGSSGCDEPGFPGVYARVGAPALHAFIDEFRPTDPTPTDDPAPQIERTGGTPALTGTLRVGEQISCATGTTTWSASGVTESYRVRLWDPFVEELTTVAMNSPYTLGAGDEGDQFVCEVHATKSGVGGYGVARSGLSAPVAAGSTGGGTPPPPSPPAPSPTPPATPIEPVAPPPVDPQPFVPEPPRDDTMPRTTRITRRCAARRCTLTVFASDPGAPASGVTGVEVTLVSRFRCTRNGHRNAGCVRIRTLRATRVRAGVFRVRTPLLRRRASHVVQVVAIDGAGNEELRARLYGFRL